MRLPLWAEKKKGQAINRSGASRLQFEPLSPAERRGEDRWIKLGDTSSPPSTSQHLPADAARKPTGWLDVGDPPRLRQAGRPSGSGDRRGMK